MHKLAGMVLLSIIALFTSVASAQGYQPERRGFSQAELDQVLAPIALYPDSLLSQILMAATYPEDVFEAAAHLRDNPGLRGEEAVRSVQQAPWDPSVISLAAFPDVVQMMDERRDWTVRLGDAYIAQPEQVLDSVQNLRRRADAAGSLRSSNEIVVQRSGDYYVIEPPAADIVYVPYYDSRVVYGNWWWPDYAPVYWNPWPGYSYRYGYRGFGWGYGVRLSSGFFFSSFDWRNRYVRFASHRPWYYHGHYYRGGQRWTHNHSHRNVVRDARWRGDGRDWRRDGRDGRDGREWRGERRETWQGYQPGDRNERRDGNRGDRDRRGQWAPPAPGQVPQPRDRVAREAQGDNPLLRSQETRPLAVPRAARAVPAEQSAPRAAAPAPAPAPAPRPERAERRAPVDPSGRNLDRNHSGG